MVINKKYDYGLAILRMLMCFMVVLCHFWDAKNVHGILEVFSYTRQFAVAVFMIMSFVFAQKFLETHDKSQVRNRFERLLIPQIGWAVIYWVVYLAIDFVSGRGTELGINDLLWQIFTGHSSKLNASMWYQIDLIYITALFLLIIVLFKKKYKYVLCILGILAILAQYTGVNMVFSSLRYELKYPLGRLAEMIPLAVIGFFLATVDFLTMVKKHRLIAIISSICLAVLSGVFLQYVEPQGYGNQGIRDIFMGLAILTFFCAIPFEKLNNSVLTVIEFISKYTMGIYCVHRLVGTLLGKVITNLNIDIIKIKSFRECVLIYLFSYLLCWIGNKIVGKTKFKSLFN